MAIGCACRGNARPHRRRHRTLRITGDRRYSTMWYSRQHLPIGGWAGIALALDFCYIAAAEVIHHQFGRMVSPLERLEPQSSST
jgi:signal transduction protein with GAF and PtsI domain